MELYVESEQMETFWLFWPRSHHSYDAAYDSDFWFSLGHELSYNSAYDSNASENQPLGTEDEWTVLF